MAGEKYGGRMRKRIPKAYELVWLGKGSNGRRRRKSQMLQGTAVEVKETLRRLCGEV